MSAPPALSWRGYTVTYIKRLTFGSFVAIVWELQLRANKFIATKCCNLFIGNLSHFETFLSYAGVLKTPMTMRLNESRAASLHFKTKGRTLFFILDVLYIIPCICIIQLMLFYRRVTFSCSLYQLLLISRIVQKLLSKTGKGITESLRQGLKMFIVSFLCLAILVLYHPYV